MEIEKYVFAIIKSGFHFKKPLKKLKKLVSTSRNMVRLQKIDFPLISIIISTYRKKTQNKTIGKTDKNLVSTFPI